MNRQLVTKRLVYVGKVGVEIITAPSRAQRHTTGDYSLVPSTSYLLLLTLLEY